VPFLDLPVTTAPMMKSASHAGQPQANAPAMLASLRATTSSAQAAMLHSTFQLQ
jgi:hypothetical protein